MKPSVLLLFIKRSRVPVKMSVAHLAVGVAVPFTNDNKLLNCHITSAVS